MPVHDWTVVPAGIFHDFHATWIPEIKSTLNNGLLPPDYYALAEKITGDWSTDVLTLQAKAPPSPRGGGTVTLVKSAPRVRFTAKSAAGDYCKKAKQIAIRHFSDDRLVAVIEIISPGNKANAANLESLVDKVAGGVAHGIHFLVVDLFPPTPRDRNGIHAEIWKRFSDEEFQRPAQQPLTLSAYEASLSPTAFIETAAVGDPLPAMPLFLEADHHIEVPLEQTYDAAWHGVPSRWRDELARA